MEEKNGVTPVLVFFILIVLSAVVFLFVKAIGFGIKKYNEYWIQNNSAYENDVKFFSVDSFDPQKLQPKDNNLKENAVKLIYAPIQGRNAEDLKKSVSVSNELFSLIDPNHGLSTPIKNWCDLFAFNVVQKDEKAIIVFDYTVIPTDIKEAEKYCYDTYKTMNRNRIYLELIDGVWTVTDVYISSR